MIYISSFIDIYIKEVIVEKFKNLSGEDIQIEKSIFDDYDKEEGYLTEENKTNIYETLKIALNNVFRFAIKQFRSTLKECLDINICELLDYVKSEMEYIEEHKDDEKDYLDD